MRNPVLTPQEDSALTLRELYSSSGFKFYRMTRFEEYDFYAGKKDFLTSKAILTFSDINGRLMALRPDVTLSVIEHLPPGKYYYDEKVYRVPKNGASFREIPQCGIEHTGPVNSEDVREAVSLALKSLHALAEGRRVALDVADAGEVSRLMPGGNIPSVLQCLSSRNIHGLSQLSAPEELIELARNGGRIPYGLESEEIRYDVSAISSLAYYSGLVFKGYIDGIPVPVLSGGQYDISGSCGIGFAVYLNALEDFSRD